MKLQIKWNLMWSFRPIHESNECLLMKRASDKRKFGKENKEEGKVYGA